MTYNYEFFGRTLALLLIENGYVRRNNNPDWIRFVASVPGVSYETLRKAVAGDRPVSSSLMRRVAGALNLEPTIFAEYRLMQTRTALDPREVGWKRATRALALVETTLADRAIDLPGFTRSD